MSLWTRNPYQSTTETAESLAYSPVGGRLKIWLAGVVCALIPIGYGVYCLRTGRAWFPGQHGSGMETHGSAAVALAIAYISIGAFLHFHYFWGLHAKLHMVSPILKLLAVVTFLGSLGFAVFKIMA